MDGKAAEGLQVLVHALAETNFRLFQFKAIISIISDSFPACIFFYIDLCFFA